MYTVKLTNMQIRSVVSIILLPFYLNSSVRACSNKTMCLLVSVNSLHAGIFSMFLWADDFFN